MLNNLQILPLPLFIFFLKHAFHDLICNTHCYMTIFNLAPHLKVAHSSSILLIEYRLIFLLSIYHFGLYIYLIVIYLIIICFLFSFLRKEIKIKLFLFFMVNQKTLCFQPNHFQYHHHHFFLLCRVFKLHFFLNFY